MMYAFNLSRNSSNILHFGVQASHVMENLCHIEYILSSSSADSIWVQQTTRPTATENGSKPYQATEMTSADFTVAL